MGKSQYEIAEHWDTTQQTICRWMNLHDIETRQNAPEIEHERLADYKWLRKKYELEGLSTPEIAEIVDTAAGVVLDWLERHGIPRRSFSEANATTEDPGREWLYEKYHEEEWSLYDIMDHLGASRCAVRRLFRIHDINVRGNSECQVVKSRPKLLDDPEWLHQHYIDQEETIEQIAEKLGCSGSCVLMSLRRHNIETRSQGIRATPENWKTTYGPNWEGARDDVLSRDGRECLNCGMTQSEHFDEYERALNVHHIKPAFTFVDDEGIFDYERANKPSNLITLCVSCHMKLEEEPEVCRQLLYTTARPGPRGRRHAGRAGRPKICRFSRDVLSKDLLLRRIRHLRLHLFLFARPQFFDPLHPELPLRDSHL